VFDESACLPATERVAIRRISRRPRYKDFFDWINEVAAPTDFSIIANTDICFDESLQLLPRMLADSRLVLALSRWDVSADQRVEIFDRGDSQDSWIFRGPVGAVGGDFPLGVYDCDNKIAWELQQAGYRVLNPAFGLRSYHHHQSGYRSYEVKPAPDYGIRPPFLYVEPENLWTPWQAWRLKRQLELKYLPWSMTWRRFWQYPGLAQLRRVWLKLQRLLASHSTSQQSPT
jgi:hypothetical protein